MSYGPKPNFHEFDVIRALYIVDTKGPIGRHLLRKELDITECSVRTILKKLIRDDFIGSTSSGQVIRKEGKKELSSWHFFDRARYIDVGNLSLGDHDFLIIADNLKREVTNGLDQRDEAIKIGGDGATILLYKDGKFHMPPGFMDLEENYPEEVKKLRSTLDLSDGDTLIIGSGKTKRLAQLAAMAAFSSLKG
ncbi:MAG TPA: DUF4443 domain-containing protein [Candidatus Methanofastidiosa archaeon]|nr:DUF4443 domain-containing protein [Candidatus Methanofastidiosa archaeon]HPR41219.1 DUF4443 domain-containing protein [Candidatus Methanofastidiosa archaeon]